MEKLIAYHGSEAEKTAIITQLNAHRAADEIIKGQYWQNGNGRAVGCTVHSCDHSLYESRFGIPHMLARLEDCIFEGLPNDKAKDWPIRFMSAVNVGADLSLVGWKFLHWILTDEKINPGICHPLVRDAVAQAAAVIYQLAQGDPPIARAESAESAARAAWRAARAASAESAAYEKMADVLIELIEAA